MNFLTTFNHNLTTVSRIADFVVSAIEEQQAARENGCELISRHDKPNAQPSYRLKPAVAQAMKDAGERLPRRVGPKTFDPDMIEVAKLPVWPTDLTPADVRKAFASIDALKGQARLIARMQQRGLAGVERVATIVGRNQTEAIDAFMALDPVLIAAAIRDFEKAHIEEFGRAATLKIHGFHQTATAAGDSTTIRYDGTRELRSNSKAQLAGSAYSPASIDEDGLADALEN